ncbi:MAG: glycoside hydrolase family 16 protein, partial [Bacteroidia bacterium]|nr:glycoside hydrolase family 16 protein [Bacteroidia bacterium]
MIGGLGVAIIIGVYSFNTIPPKDTINEKKPVITTHFFKNNLSFNNAWIKFKYGFQKHRPRIVPLLSDSTQWQLSFYDEFDSLDTKKWRLGQAWGEFHPEHLHQYYSKEMIQTIDGKLVLKGEYAPKSYKIGDSLITIPFGVGLINSDISFQQKYGYFEIRSKNPKGAATWPAFWLTGANRWPPEIDIFEMYGRKNGRYIHHQYSTIHYGKADTRSRGYLSKRINLPNSTDTLFHTYGCEWSPKYLK